MNGQQMIEHLIFILKISNGKVNAASFVEEDKAVRRKAFLDTENELQSGFKPTLLSEEPYPVKFETIAEAIDHLFLQVTDFHNHFKIVPLENHPFFGELDYNYWKKFHVKHFTHHFKQFNLF